MLNITKYIPDGIEDVAFDWNGTLLNDVSYCLTVTNSLLLEHRLPHLSVERYRQIFRFPVRDYYQDLGFDFVSQPFETVSDQWVTRYNAAAHTIDLFDQ